MAFFSSTLFFQVFWVILAFFGIVYAYFEIVVFNYWKSKGVVQVNPVVPFGSLWPIFKGEKSIGEFLRDEYLQLKKNPIFGLYAFHRRTLVVCHPDLIRFVLTKEFLHFQDRGMFCNEEVDPLSGQLFLLPGRKWKNLRVKLTPTFTSGKIKHMFTMIKDCADNLVKCLELETNQNELVEVKDLMARFSTDVIASTAFGIDCKCLENADAEFRFWGRKVFEPKLVNNTLMTLCPSVLNFFKIGVIDKGASDFFIKTYKEAVEYRISNNIVRKDFLDLIIQLLNKGYIQADDGKQIEPTQENVNGKITMLEGAAQAFVFWIGGFETSSTAATHCLYELALYQDIQEKLFDEIKSVLEKFGDLTYESIKEMTYLHKVVLETLRKYPSVPLLTRECGQEIELPGTGLRISKGTMILIPVLGLHWDPDVFPEPEKFDPERFDEVNIANRHRYSYLPFGEGPRNCIGMRFGLLQTKMALITVVSKYRIIPGPDIKIPLPVDKGNMLHGPIDGVTLKLEKR